MSKPKTIEGAVRQFRGAAKPNAELHWPPHPLIHPGAASLYETWVRDGETYIADLPDRETLEKGAKTKILKTLKEHTRKLDLLMRYHYQVDTYSGFIN